MSNTRHAPAGAPFRQERFSSSKVYDKALPGNLVAKRAKLIVCPEDRALVCFLQQLSHCEGGVERVAHNTASMFPGKIGMLIGDIADFLRRLCLDPEIDIGKLGVGHYRNLLKSLYEYRHAHIKRAENELASTSVSLKVYEDLKFALATKSLVIIEGLERMGKSVTARNFCALHPGQAIYISLESGSDETSFFRTFAKALGTACSTQCKTNDMRLRVEDMLQEVHLMLVIDEAHFLWPQIARARRAPSRVDWVRTALVDYGVPVALISTPQFDRQCEIYEKHIGWNARQIKGRVALHTLLPSILPEADLKAIAKHMLPEADAATLLRLIGFAQASDDYVAGIERILKRVSYFAHQ